MVKEKSILQSMALIELLISLLTLVILIHMTIQNNKIDKEYDFFNKQTECIKYSDITQCNCFNQLINGTINKKYITTPEILMEYIEMYKDHC